MSKLKPWLPLLKKVVPVLISLVLIGLIVSYAPWPAVYKALTKLSPAVILLLLAISTAHFFLKAVRFHFLLQAMGIREPFGMVFLSYMSAQPVSLLPGGEIYRTRTLEKLTGVPMKKSIPTFTTQGLLEGGTMAVLGLICALAIGTLRTPVLILTLLILVSIFLIESGYMMKLLPVLNKLPLVSISRQRIEEFTKSNQAIFTWRWMPILLALSFLVEALGAAVPYVAAKGLGDEISVFQAVLMYIVPVLVGFISLLPGGFGAAEQSAIGIMLLSGASIAIAVAVTLVMRVSLVVVGFIYGVIFQLIVRASGLYGK